MRGRGTALVAAALLTTSACGGVTIGGGASRSGSSGNGSGDRPSVHEVVTSIAAGTAGGLMEFPAELVTSATVDCVARAVVDSELSDAAVRALVAGNPKFRARSADTRALTAIASAMGECATATDPSP